MSATDATPELAQIEAIIAAIDRDARHEAGERAERRERRGAQARAGRMGPDWQQVQRRIDAGETTVEDVFAGRDQSPAARRLVELSQANLTELGRLAQEDPGVREEVAELDHELSQWDEPGDAGSSGVGPGGGLDPDLGPDAAPAPTIRSATDPTAGVTPVDDADPPVPAERAAPDDDAPRDPVADRVDATGLEPPAPDA